MQVHALTAVARLLLPPLCALCWSIRRRIAHLSACLRSGGAVDVALAWAVGGPPNRSASMRSATPIGRRPGHHASATAWDDATTRRDDIAVTWSHSDGRRTALPTAQDDCELASPSLRATTHRQRERRRMGGGCILEKRRVGWWLLRRSVPRAAATHPSRTPSGAKAGRTNTGTHRDNKVGKERNGGRERRGGRGATRVGADCERFVRSSGKREEKWQTSRQHRHLFVFYHKHLMSLI